MGSVGISGTVCGAAGNAPSPYLLLIETLAGIWEMLSLGLMCSEQQPIDPPDIIEIRLVK